MKNIDVKEFSLDSKELDRFEKEYNEDKKNVVIRHALNKNNINDVVFDGGNGVNNLEDFSINIKTLPVCDQKQSGRCWIFAACNVLREDIAKACNLDNFELSQNFVAYYDKLEKANFLMSSIADLVENDHDERLLRHLLFDGINDGGQWQMYVNIVKKYGLVPKNAMKETYQSSGTRVSDALLNSLCRQFAVNAQNLQKNGRTSEILTLKNDYMNKVFALLNNCFGVPPKKFDFEYTDKEGVYHLEKDLTPKSFFEKYVGDKIDDYISLINSPTADKPFNKTYTINYLNNTVEGKDIIHLNVPMERMKELIIKQLSDGRVVWFGSDVSHYRNNDNGYWDDLSFDYMSAFGFDIKFGKTEMLDYWQSAMNHAMVITGVNIKDGKPTRWKIENSWGKDGKSAGFYGMSASWFDRFVYQAVVDKKYLSNDELEALKGKPIELNPWDPMGTLAD